MNKKWLTVVFGSALFLAACGGGGEKSTSGGTTEQTEGEKIVMQNCATCHGGNLQGMSSAPALNNVGSRLSQDEILDIILNGTGNKGMPAGLIQGEQAEKAAEWLATQK
ncbi:cytochrome c551 [Solibacillus sp. CAU 1738]|uniref:cytochrome c551 n=1 Tax=Solibacillus sp. CAU 1738 TaxID=3140363 RepID=UPI003260A1C1